MNVYSLMGLWNPIWNICLIYFGVMLVAIGLNWYFESPDWITKEIEIDPDEGYDTLGVVLVVCFIAGVGCILYGFTKTHGVVWDFSFTGSYQVFGLAIIICGIVSTFYGFHLFFGPTPKCYEKKMEEETTIDGDQAQMVSEEIVGMVVALVTIGAIGIITGLAMVMGTLG